MTMRAPMQRVVVEPAVSSLRDFLSWVRFVYV
jgi:hypothetical protein